MGRGDNQMRTWHCEGRRLGWDHFEMTLAGSGQLMLQYNDLCASVSLFSEDIVTLAIGACSKIHERPMDQYMKDGFSSPLSDVVSYIHLWGWWHYAFSIRVLCFALIYLAVIFLSYEAIIDNVTTKLSPCTDCVTRDFTLAARALRVLDCVEAVCTMPYKWKIIARRNSVYSNDHILQKARTRTQHGDAEPTRTIRLIKQTC